MLTGFIASSEVALISSTHGVMRFRLRVWNGPGPLNSDSQSQTSARAGAGKSSVIRAIPTNDNARFIAAPRLSACTVTCTGPGPPPPSPALVQARENALNHAFSLQRRIVQPHDLIPRRRLLRTEDQRIVPALTHEVAAQGRV